MTWNDLEMLTSLSCSDWVNSQLSIWSTHRTTLRLWPSHLTCTTSTPMKRHPRSETASRGNRMRTKLSRKKSDSNRRLSPPTNTFLSYQLMSRVSATNASTAQSISSQRSTCRSTTWSLIQRWTFMLSSSPKRTLIRHQALIKWDSHQQDRSSQFKWTTNSKSLRMKNCTPKSGLNCANSSQTT